jgi:hypothetical protein
MKLKFDMVLAYDQEYIANGNCMTCKRRKYRADITTHMCVVDGKESVIDPAIFKNYFRCDYLMLEHPVKRDLKKL